MQIFRGVQIPALSLTPKYILMKRPKNKVNYKSGLRTSSDVTLENLINRGVNLLQGPKLHLEIAHPYQSWLPLPGKSVELRNETLNSLLFSIIQLARVGNG